MNDWRARILLAAIAVVSVALLRLDATPGRPGSADAEDPTRLLTTPAAGFSRAAAPRAFEFPRDHGPHEDFQTEWWYFTGHLASEDGSEFGFQLTLFRFEIAASITPSPSAWRTPRVLLGHFAVSDFDQRRFHTFERLARAHPDIARIETSPLALHLDDWSIERDAKATAEHWQIRATQDSIALELTLETRQPAVLQGTDGLSRKSATEGNASYYYSLPRLTATGELTVDGQTRAVSGEAWLDREWSSSALEAEQQGWDWFALQLADGSNLMFYQLREAGGAAGAQSAGSFVMADGSVDTLSVGDVEVVVTHWWRSPITGRRYPHGWRLSVPRHDLALTLTPRLADQEWHGRLHYWEGAVRVSGSHAGRGYVELTGY
ncbi:MAG: lipocalin-like domain-containing protein [Gammaproteobacteria bacterium]